MGQADIVAAIVIEQPDGVLAEDRVFLSPVVFGSGDADHGRVHVVGSATELTARVLGPGGEGGAAPAQIVLGARHLEREVGTLAVLIFV